MLNYVSWILWLKKTSKLIYVNCYCKHVYIINVLSFVGISNVT